MIRKNSLMMLIVAVIFSFFGSNLMAQDKATRLGLHFTQEELNIWKQRAKQGPFKSKGDYKSNTPGDWDRIVANANSFLGNPSHERWRGDGSTTSCIPQWSAEPHHNGINMRDAAFVYLVTGEQKYFDPVRKELLAQASEPMTDFSNRRRWCIGAGQLGDINPGFIISEWMLRVMFAYDYVKHSMTDAERQKMEKWFRDAAYYFLLNVEDDINKLWADRLNDNYSPTAVQDKPSSSYTHHNGYHVSKGSIYYNNRRTNQMSFVGQAAVLVNDDVLKDRSKRFVKEFVKYATFPDGTLSDMYRGQSSSRNKGLNYILNQLKHMTQVADVFARAGDTELYDFTTSEGIKQTAGGQKNLKLAVKRTIQYMDKGHKPYRYVTSDPSTIINGEDDWITDIWYSQENMYFRDQYIKDAYTRNNTNITNGRFPSSAQRIGPHHPWSGAGNSIPGMMFMFADMEDKVWPYDAEPGAGFNAAPVIEKIEDQGMNVGSESKVQVAATDKEGDAITLSAENLPSFITFKDNGNGTGEFVIKPVSGDYGDYSITLKATDAENREASVTYNVFVNDLAVCAPIKASEAQSPNLAENVLDNDLSTRWSAEGKGQYIQFDLCEEKVIDQVEVAFMNGDSRTASFEIMTSLDGFNYESAYKGTSSGTTAEIETYAFDAKKARYVRFVGYGNSANEWNSVLEISFFADGDSGSGTEQPPVGNAKPVFNEVSDTKVEFGKAMEITVEATDADGDSIKIEALEMPVFATFANAGEGKATINISPTKEHAGNHMISVRASDAEGSDTLSFMIDVVAPAPCEPSISASKFQEPNKPEFAFDGDLTTRWSAEGVGEWLQYDFCEVKEFSSVDMAFLYGTRRKTMFAIEMSVDGTNWTTVFDGESNGTTSELENFELPTTKARFVKIIGKGNSEEGSDWNSILEVSLNEASEENGNTTPTECVVSASASKFQEPNKPEFAFDGDLTTRWSAEGVGEWLAYNFCEVKEIESVDVSFLYGDQRQTYFSIEVSMDGTNWEEVYNGESSGTTAEFENFKFPAVSAKQVRIIGKGNSNPSSDWNSIQEVRFNAPTETETPEVNTTPMLSVIYQIKEGETTEIMLSPIASDDATVKQVVTDLPGFAEFNETADRMAKISLAPVAGDQGEYTIYVTLSDANNVISTTALVIKVEGDLSLLEQESTKNIGLNVYPNPVNDYLMVDFKDEMTGDVKLTYFDELGNEIGTDASVLTNETEIKFDVTKQNISKGIFHVKVNADNIDQTFRLWKN